MTHSDPGYGIAPPGFRLPRRLGWGWFASRWPTSRVLPVLRRDAGPARWSGARVAAPSPPEAAAPLVELLERPGASRPRRGQLGLYHFAILLPDRPRSADSCAHLGESARAPALRITW